MVEQTTSHWKKAKWKPNNTATLCQQIQQIHGDTHSGTPKSNATEKPLMYKQQNISGAWKQQSSTSRASLVVTVWWFRTVKSYLFKPDGLQHESLNVESNDKLPTGEAVWLTFMQKISGFDRTAHNVLLVTESMDEKEAPEHYFLFLLLAHFLFRAVVSSRRR